MNNSILTFAKKHRAKFDGNILEVGSQDVNGSIRNIIDVTMGTDMREGPGVDVVVNVEELIEWFDGELFDCVVSCDALEHMADWEAALTNMWGVLKPGGLMLLTMANTKKGYHGYPHDYWRWTLPDFCRLFAKNPIIDSFEGGPSMGVVVRKDHPLDLTVKPMKVKQ